MKFTMSWLKEHLETEASLSEIAETLTDLGLEVEEIADPAATLGAFTICRVIEAVQHPNADRLRLCRVEAWPDGAEAPSQEVQVVCGAPNARTGLVGVFARPGLHIPGTGVDLKPGVIRGVESNGMLCSERELMVSEDHDGIIDLPEDAPLGARYIDYAGLNDPMIYIKITPNRPDALAVSGIARDLAARGLGRLITPATEPVPGGHGSPIKVTLGEDVADKACPLFIGRHFRGVKNGPSPDWMQRRLRAVGLRPISALVDVTNYLTYDRGRPLHVFDAAKVKGDIHVRLSRPGETLLALDGKEYSFDDAMTLICDDAGPEGIGGVMGGEHSGCTEETTDVFLEAAYFDPIRTATTGRKLRINSDARYRFERGIDPAFTAEGMEIASRLILEICGGEASEPVVAGAVPDTARSYTLDPARAASLVGMDIPREEQVRILEALGFTVEDHQAGLIAATALAPAATAVVPTVGDLLTVSPPSWRPDILGEADLVEEIARIASLTKLEARPLPPRAGIAKPILTPGQRRAGAVRRSLAAAGFNECVTYAFIAEGEAALFGGGAEGLKLENPISSEMSEMRPSLYPGLLAAAARNQARGLGDMALFELGPIFTGAEPGEETAVAAGLLAGATAPRHWSGARRAVDALDAKAAAEAALAAAGVDVGRLMLFRDLPGWFHPGRSARIGLGPKLTLGEFGELHPKTLDAMGVKGPAAGFAVYLDRIPEPRSRSNTRPALAASDFQAVERDFAFVVDARIEAADLAKAARKGDKQLIERVEIFDIFEGTKAEAQLGAGKKSVAVSVRLQPADRTLRDEEIEAVSARIVEAVTAATGATLRS